MEPEGTFSLEWKVDSTTDHSYISIEFYNMRNVVYFTIKQDGNEVISSDEPCTLSADDRRFTLPAILWDKTNNDGVIEGTGVRGSLSLEYSNDVDDNPNRVYLCGDMRIRINGEERILPWDRIVVYSF